MKTTSVFKGVHQGKQYLDVPDVLPLTITSVSVEHLTKAVWVILKIHGWQRTYQKAEIKLNVVLFLLEDKKSWRFIV